MTIELAPADESQKLLLTQLLELHLHDLSEITGDEVGPDGRFGYKYIDLYWYEAGRRPIVISYEKRVCGFVLVRLAVDSLTHPGRKAHHIAEFFVLRKYRRMGIGTRAALKVFALFPGFWEVSQAAGHSLAVDFWRRTIGELTDGDFRETFMDEPGWHGTVISFENGS